MTLQFVQATKEDILSIDPQLPQCASDTLNYGREAFERDLIPLEDRAIAIREDGHCVGAYGLIEMWPGVARIWALFSQSLLKEHAALLALHAKRDLKHGEQFGFHRLEATTGVDHATGIAFLEWLGFQQEGLMRRYTPSGEDTYLYARVRDES